MGNPQWESWAGGDYRQVPMTTDLKLCAPFIDTPRVIILDPSGTRSVTLPDATKCRRGSHLYYVINISNSVNLTVRDFTGAVLATLAGSATSEGAKIHLVSNSTPAGSWALDIRGMRRAV